NNVLKPKINIPFVRRLTGGAAILHHREITYSLICSLDDLSLPREVKKSYEILNSFIKEFYRKLNLKAEFAKDIFSSDLERRENFCYSGCEHFDFIINGKKIGGNAQRRKRDLIFQHGSIPQDLDFALIESSINNTQLLSLKTTFLKELLPAGENDFWKIGHIFYKAFQNIFNVNFNRERLSAEERHSSYRLMETKYTTKEWNFDKINLNKPFPNEEAILVK
ncbi:MAG: hypothetical protein WC546_04500, partial [Candidatus Omnitrophota bacterium]